MGLEAQLLTPGDGGEAKVEEPSLCIPGPRSAGWDGRAGPGGRRGRRGGRIRRLERADGDERGAQLSCQMRDGSPLTLPLAGAGGRHGQCWQPAASVIFPFFSLIWPSPALLGLCLAVGEVAGGRTGDNRTLEQPLLQLRDLARHLLPARKAEPREVK